MKQFTFFLLLIFYACTGFAQQVFFKSAQAFNKNELSEFYASVTATDSLILFNANDYKIYAYTKNDGTLKWTYYLQRKGNIPPFVANNAIWASGNNEVVQLNVSNGTLIRKLKVSTLDSPPLIINDTLYGTGIYDAGNLYAYDLKADSVLWTQFISHGITTRPYYQPNKIIANGESENWIEVNYNGKLKDVNCQNSEQVFPSELSCVKKFLALTHDEKEIKGKLAEKINPGLYNIPDVYYGTNNTYILCQQKLFVLGNKLKLRWETDLNQLSDSIELSSLAEEKILKADEEKVWLFAGNYLLVYNYKKKNLEQAVNLKEWDPHQAILDDNKLWLVSRNDGLLYGLTIE